MNDKELLHFFNSHQLSFEVFNHAAVFSAGDAKDEMALIPGMQTKNLFLKDKKKNYILVSVCENKRVDLKRLSEQLSLGRFSFCNAKELQTYIGVTPGSVTPYGLIHDTDSLVKYYIDEDLLLQATTLFHPLRNDQTISMPTNFFLDFFELINHPPLPIAIPASFQTLQDQQ